MTVFNKEEAVLFDDVEENLIQMALERTGKGDLQQQLNCGACATIPAAKKPLLWFVG
jgi:hypothetical protein